MDAARRQGAKLVEATGGEKGFRDTNYIFLSFVTKYLPAGIVGLLIAVILAATMSSSSGEINSLATVSVVDIYKRHFRKGATDHHYLTASRVATAFWGAYAVAFAGLGKHLGVADRSGEYRGVAVLRIAAGSVRAGLFLQAGERHRRVLWACSQERLPSSRRFVFTGISFLWYNVIGCVVVIATAMAVSFVSPAASATPDTAR